MQNIIKRAGERDINLRKFDSETVSGKVVHVMSKMHVIGKINLSCKIVRHQRYNNNIRVVKGAGEG